MTRRARILAPLVVLGLGGALAACGGSGDSPPAASDAPPPLTSTPPATQTTATATTPQTTPAQTTSTATTPATTPTTPPPTATSPPQATGGAPAGCPHSSGGFIRDVRASGTDCGRARDVADAWFRAVHGGAAPDTQIAAAGYTCTGQLVGERASVTCATADGARRIAFTASP